jgi:hypothetical protein
VNETGVASRAIAAGSVAPHEQFAVFCSRASREGGMGGNPHFRDFMTRELTTGLIIDRNAIKEVIEIIAVGRASRGLKTEGIDVRNLSFPLILRGQ